MAIIKRVMRDNTPINFIVRNCIRLFQNKSKLFRSLTSKYRIFGEARLTVNGVKFKVYSESDDFIANDLYYGFAYEEGELKLIKTLLNNARNFVDVGANTGIFSVYGAIANKNLNVISFEPHPSNYKRLRKNVTLNDLDNVKTYPMAVGSRAETVKFTVPRDFSLSTTASINNDFTTNFHKDSYTEVLVEQVTLDSILYDINITPKDIIKIDVEYYEFEVLKGAINILNTKRPMIIIEILDYVSLITQFPNMEGRLSANYNQQIFEIFYSHGYHGYQIQPDAVSLITDVGPFINRNFLFMPYRLNKPNLTFEEITIESFVKAK